MCSSDLLLAFLCAFSGAVLGSVLVAAEQPAQALLGVVPRLGLRRGWLVFAQIGVVLGLLAMAGATPQNLAPFIVATLAVAVFGALVLLLAGCTAQTPGLLSSSPSPGYLSADETVREIPADQRDDPVTFTGTTDTEVTLDVAGTPHPLALDSITRAVVQVELNRSIDDEGQ